MKSKVYAISMRASDKENMLKKLTRLIQTMDLSRGIEARDLVALKLHFGERGSTAFIRPLYVRMVVDEVHALKAHPFITDTNTLYLGTRTNAAQHLKTAVENGFAYSVVGAPLTIADGLKGTSVTEVEINMPQIQTAYVGTDIAEADALISLAHFKLHEVAGFGGAIKNLGMGGAARRGKMAQHASVSPKVKNKKCIGCGECVDHCAQEAIALVDVNGKEKAKIDPDKCVGCAECIPVCPQSAIEVSWNADVPLLLKKMCEYAYAAIKGKQDKSFFVNFLTQISPACDCHPSSDAAIVRDIGILASTDPVAVDQASVDLLMAEPALPGTCLTKNTGPGEDKIRGVYPHIEWEIQFKYAQEIGLGSCEYDLEWIDKEL